MINVKEVFKLNKNTTVLVCDMFSDDEVKGILESNIGKYKDFEIETVKNCFSAAKTRNIILFGEDDYSGITKIKFV